MKYQTEHKITQNIIQLLHSDVLFLFDAQTICGDVTTLLAT